VAGIVTSLILAAGFAIFPSRAARRNVLQADRAGPEARGAATW
jgi:hypothetical protein